MARLRSGDKIALSAGSTELVEYNEWDEASRRGEKKRRWWCCVLSLAGNRISLIQNWDDKNKRSTNLAWVRKRCEELLDRIAPGWKVVK